MSPTVFLTGATGFLGINIAACLLRNTSSKVIVLVRAKNEQTAVNRLSRIWWDWPEIAQSIGTRVQVLAGDVSEPQFGLGKIEYEGLINNITHIIHSAADIRLHGPLEELWKANVQGTNNVLELGRNIHHQHGLTRFSHVSTAYVAGLRKGIVSEDSLTDKYGFSNNYEYTKYESEKLVKEARNEFPVSIFRPGLIVGDSQSGVIKTFNTLYYPLKLYLTGRLRIFPISPFLRVNLVPVDYVAEIVTGLTFEDKAENLTFHVTVPWHKLPKAYELFNYIHIWAKKEKKIDLPRPILIPIPATVTRKSLQLAQRLVRHGRNRPLIDALNILSPYFMEKRQYLRDNIDRIAGEYDFRWQNVIRPILDFAFHLSFFHRTDRTVHEQIFYRLKSKSNPIKYYDVVEGNITSRNTDQILNEILIVAKALIAMGVKKGDRIAITGPNSSRYLTIDVSIGLVGAVSIPLYYARPVAEIEKILEASNAKIIFIGSSEIIEHINKRNINTPVVSFCWTDSDFTNMHDLVTWDKLIDRGRNVKEDIDSIVNFGDLATVRYKSSTIDRFKGACFDHGQIRWMAESLCSLFHWKTRNTEVCYISCLPLNYVIEGILAAYSPYYTPSKVSIYYLYDMEDLETSLPRIRPTLFFSIPRFYEKIWASSVKTRIGHVYANTEVDVIRKILRPVLRRRLLKKAGLDRCKQLIVGAAPSDEKLLRKFQELGVEIHNAYGLTEAPLVAMNRLGYNHISTVGEPIAETKLRIADDGEVMVQGPQLTRGYLDQNIESPLQDGWLLTGDLGHITKANSLVISGRKKECIITSYGMSVDPVKVESLLKRIPRVKDAVVLGDGKPFCCAILWVDNKEKSPELKIALNQAVHEVNNQLSHPEQLKKWAVLNSDPPVVHEDLISSSKPRHRDEPQQLSELVASLYEGLSPKDDNIFFIGMIDSG